MTGESSPSWTDLPDFGADELELSDPASLFGEQPLVRPDATGAATAAAASASASAASATASTQMATASSAAVLQSSEPGVTGLPAPFPSDQGTGVTDDLFGTRDEPVGDGTDDGGLTDLFGTAATAGPADSPVEDDLFGPAPDPAPDPFAPVDDVDPAAAGDNATAPTTESTEDHSTGAETSPEFEPEPVEQMAHEGAGTSGADDTADAGHDAGSDTDLASAG